MDCWCEVSAAKQSVRAIRFLDPARDVKGLIGRPLAALLRRLGATRAARDPSALIGARRTYVEVIDGGEAFLLVSVRRSGASWSHVIVRTFERGLLSELLDARISLICDGHGLSLREQQVLRLLQRGHGIDYLAAVLDITPRTVQFHLGNIMRKLGAESRMDLLRVLLP